MRIGIVTDNYFPSLGGTEISINNYKRWLEKMGHEVFVFCPSYGKNMKKDKDSFVVRLPSIRNLYRDHPLFIISKKTVDIFKSYNLDIIHSHTPITAPYLARKVANKLNLPHVHTVHTLTPEQARQNKHGFYRAFCLYFFQSLYLRTFKYPKSQVIATEDYKPPLKIRLSWAYLLRLADIPDAIIFPTSFVREMFMDRGFNKYSVILPTFTDMFTGKDIKKPPRSRGDAVTIISVGRLDVEKRPYVLLKAAAYLPENINWKMLIVGDGVLLPSLKSWVRARKLNKRITFMGRKPQSTVAKLLRHSDVFVLVSYNFDTQAIVLLEAASAGLPIVYCDKKLNVGVSRTNSILAKPDPHSISKALEKTIRDSSLRKRLSKGSLAMHEKYSPRKLTEQLLKNYRKFIEIHSKEQGKIS